MIIDECRTRLFTQSVEINDIDWAGKITNFIIRSS
jgi:hypothetical protein